MASAKKLASGSFRVQASKQIDGIRIVKSFTVSPKDFGGDWRKAKAKAELLAREWTMSQEDAIVNGLRVRDALSQYIEDRSRTMSPCTLREYRNTIKHLEPINDLFIADIDTPTIQRLINDMALDVKKKTIKNRISLLLSALDYAGIDKKFKIRYPESYAKKVLPPDIEDIKMYLKNASEDMLPIIYLGAFGSLRRGEICGLREKDISREMCLITVSGDMVKGPDGWTYKPPKTPGSIRTVQLPKFIIDSIPKKDSPDDFIFEIAPSTITDRFTAMSHKMGLEFTFHSLRHFAASFRSDLNIPKKYIQEVGGWVDGNNSVLDRVYDNKLDSSRKKYTQIANNYIEDNFDIRKSC